MKKGVKIGLIVVAGMVLLLVAFILLLPVFLSPERFKPEIEGKLTEALGRPVSLGEDLTLKLFPTAALSFSNLTVENPEGFREKHMVSIDSFEVQAELLPLISGRLEIKRFVVQRPRLVLEQLADGRGNWESTAPAEPKEGKPDGSPEGESPNLPHLLIGDFRINDGSILWLDHKENRRREISNLVFTLTDVMPGHAVPFHLTARLDALPFELGGTIGPEKKQDEQAEIPLQMKMKAVDHFELDLSGKVQYGRENNMAALQLNVPPFSLRRFMAALNPEEPIFSDDENNFEKVGLQTKIEADAMNLALSGGRMILDDSNINFYCAFSRAGGENVNFDAQIDRIDLDRYIGGNDRKRGEKPDDGKEEKEEKQDPLGGLHIQGRVRSGEVKAGGFMFQDLDMKVTGKDGVVTLDPTICKLYQGNMDAGIVLDMSGKRSKYKVDVAGDNIQVGPIFRALNNRTFMEGTMRAASVFQWEDMGGKETLSTLNGKGNILIRDGSMEGVDLSGVIYDALAKVGVTQKKGRQSRMAFSVHEVPFTITNGVISTTKTYLKSADLTAVARGKVNLVKQWLNLRVDNELLNGINVPVLVQGSLRNPSFKPDYSGITGIKLDNIVPSKKDMKKIIPDKLPDMKDLKKKLPF